MAFQDPKFSKKRTVQKFNLKELLGRSPTNFEKQQFITEALNFIRDRTEAGKDINLDNFERYTKEYADLKGVPRTEVNMRLLGDMLSSIQRGSERTNIVKLEITDTTEALKSYNHNTGDTLPKRTWFGLTEEDAKEIAKEIKPQTLGDILDQLGGLTLEQIDGEG